MKKKERIEKLRYIQTHILCYFPLGLDPHADFPRQVTLGNGMPYGGLQGALATVEDLLRAEGIKDDDI